MLSRVFDGSDLVRVNQEGRNLCGPERRRERCICCVAAACHQDAADARAIVTRPTVILADEPTGNLDTARSREIMDLLEGLNRDEGITILMVTHEPDMAAYAHRLVQFVDGRIASDGRAR